MNKETSQRVEQKTELELQAEKFLDLLYHYDFVGKDAYFRKADPGLFIKGKPLFERSDYRVRKGNKYIWIDTPNLLLGITKDGDFFIPKNYWSFGHWWGENIGDFLDPGLWGKNIFRVHTSARHGIGQYESAEFHYHNLHFRHSRHSRTIVA